ncbi:hypothetical protein DFJ74DRAFT_669227 [Hyaloraphidium curvatum]|nr:hypothetical protein DFJ74DRAFT_669227 [Hyaloraphidium curvatum]
MPMPIRTIAASPPTTQPMIRPRLAGASAGGTGGTVAVPPEDHDVVTSPTHSPMKRSWRRQLPPFRPETADWNCDRPVPGMALSDQKVGRMPCRGKRSATSVGSSAGRSVGGRSRAARRARRERRASGTRSPPVAQLARSSREVSRFARHADELPDRTSLYSEQLGAPWQSTIQLEPLVPGSRKHCPETALHCMPQLVPLHAVRLEALVKTLRKLLLPAYSTVGVPVGVGRREREMVLVVLWTVVVEGCVVVAVVRDDVDAAEAVDSELVSVVAEADAVVVVAEGVAAELVAVVAAEVVAEVISDVAEVTADVPEVAAEVPEVAAEVPDVTDAEALAVPVEPVPDGAAVVRIVAVWATQRPSEQRWVSRHLVPQEPQFEASLCVSTQPPKHRVRPAGHVCLAKRSMSAAAGFAHSAASARRAAAQTASDAPRRPLRAAANRGD